MTNKQTETNGKRIEAIFVNKKQIYVCKWANENAKDYSKSVS